MQPWNSEYFYNDFLKISPSINETGDVVPKVFIAYIVGIVIVFLCIQNGVK